MSKRIAVAKYKMIAKNKLFYLKPFAYFLSFSLNQIINNFKTIFGFFIVVKIK